MRVAYQGEPGAFSEAGTIDYFGPETITVAQDRFDGVFRAVNTGQCEAGFNSRCSHYIQNDTNKYKEKRL